MKFELNESELERNLDWLKSKHTGLNDYGIVIRHLLNEIEELKQRQETRPHETIVMPELTSFEVSKFERERDVMAYLAETIELLGGDGGPDMDTLQNWLYRLRKKAMRA